MKGVLQLGQADSAKSTRAPIHDVLRMAHFLAVSPDEITAAVFEDAGGVATAADQPERKERKKGRRPRPEGAVPLLEAAFRLFGWKDETEAAAALNSTPTKWAAGGRARRRWHSPTS